MPIFADPYFYGDSDQPLRGRARAESQELEHSQGQLPHPGAAGVIGDAPALTDRSFGGADEVRHFGGISSAVAIGDAQTISGHAHGGDDTVLAVARGSAEAYGDALTMSGHAMAGDDHVSVVSRFNSRVFGDAQSMTGHAVGGDDTLSASADIYVTPNLFGDAESLQGHARGGDDLLIASTASSLLYGDARSMTGHSRGGDDTLVGGRGADVMYGDAEVLGRHVRPGADLFVLAEQNGHDRIMDFQLNHDRISLQGVGVTSFEDLAQRLHDTVDGVLIRFDDDNDALLRGVSAAQLRESHFVFV